MTIRPYIGIIGASTISEDIEQLAFAVGEEIGKRNGILICGGLGGVMEAACRGAKSVGGTTVGFLPGFRREEANPYVDIAITTGLLEMRNLIIVRTSDVLIAIAKGYGTLSEIGFALKLEKPVVGLKSFDDELPLIKAKSPKEAVIKAWELIENKDT